MGLGHSLLHLQWMGYQTLSSRSALLSWLLSTTSSTCAGLCQIVPKVWKHAHVKLIGNPSATSDPSSPTNFRPIALTPCVGKLFSTIIRNRLLKFMLANRYLDRSIQKAFMPATPGCAEHHLKLSTILSDAKQRHRSLAICWVHLANAYGSVHYSLMYPLLAWTLPCTLQALQPCQGLLHWLSC